MANEFREAARAMVFAVIRSGKADTTSMTLLIAEGMEIAAHVTSEWCKPEYEPTEDEWTRVAARVKERITNGAQ